VGSRNRVLDGSRCPTGSSTFEGGKGDKMAMRLLPNYFGHLFLLRVTIQ